MNYGGSHCEGYPCIIMLNILLISHDVNKQTNIGNKALVYLFAATFYGFFLIEVSTASIWAFANTQKEHFSNEI